MGPATRGGVHSRKWIAIGEEHHADRSDRDLAKYVFEVHGVGAQDETILRKTLRRDAVVPFFAELPTCLVGMEASNGAHYRAKVLCRSRSRGAADQPAVRREVEQ